MKITFDDDHEATTFYDGTVVPILQASGAVYGSALGTALHAAAERLARQYFEHFEARMHGALPTRAPLARRKKLERDDEPKNPVSAHGGAS